MNSKSLSWVVLPLFLIGCGGGGGSATSSTPPASITSTPETVEETSTTETPTTYTGIFLDSAVEGLTYTTESSSGLTNENGEFTYQLDENIEFSIGGITFPAIPAKSVITPLDVFNTQDLNHTSVVNTLRLLQTLDLDGNAENGIQISTEVRELAELVSVDFSSLDFDTVVEALVQMSGNINQQLISSEVAIFHFETTLAALNNQNMENCDKTHSRVGYFGSFSTIAHNVSGRAEIIDDCTIRITEFSYDGGGPVVYFYAGNDHDYSSDEAFLMGPKLNGTVFENDEIIIRLPNNKTLDDFNSLSVWCVEFTASFGELIFTP